MSRFRPAPDGRNPLDRVLGRRGWRRSAVDPHQPVVAARPRGRFGFWGPLPFYSRRTRGGSEVSVGGCGCCLPIPLIGVLGTIGGLRALWRRLR